MADNNKCDPQLRFVALLLERFAIFLISQPTHADRATRSAPAHAAPTQSWLRPEQVRKIPVDNFEEQLIIRQKART
jgi:hypothetical protein